MSKPEEYLEKVISLTRKAGEETLKFYEEDYRIEEKKDDSPVTEADLASEAILIEGLKQTGPGIIAEERGLIPGESEDSYWIVDPLDGTQDFIDRTGEFSVMVGLLVNGRPRAGVVFAPAKGKLWYAVQGRGAHLVEQGVKRELSVTGKEDLAEYVLIASRNHFSEKDRILSEKLGVEDVVRMGSLGIKFCSIAEGEADIVFYTTDRLGIWDCCAPEIILKEAGGQAFDVKGHQLKYDLEGRRMTGGVVGLGGGGCREEVVEILDDSFEGFD